MKKKNPVFLRRASSRHSKLGLRRKKKQKWRKPTGRHNKLRTQQKGKEASVSIGYGNSKEERGRINGRVPVIINNIKDMAKVRKEQIAVLGRMGMKKKIEIAKIAKEKGILMQNLKVNRILKKMEKKK